MVAGEDHYLRKPLLASVKKISCVRKKRSGTLRISMRSQMPKLHWLLLSTFVTSQFLRMVGSRYEEEEVFSSLIVLMCEERNSLYCKEYILYIK